MGHKSVFEHSDSAFWHVDIASDSGQQCNFRGKPTAKGYNRLKNIFYWSQ